MAENNCVFCKIISGEIPSITVYEDQYFKAIFDISPASKGHTLVLPKKHMANIFEMDDDISTKALPLISKLASALKDELHCDGINILQNNGVAAGQSVFHLHFHIIPRFDDDKVILPWKTSTYGDGEAQALAESIQKRLTVAGK